jgi:hypothetical protein
LYFFIYFYVYLFKMDLAILAGVGVFGYLQNQKQRENYFKASNETNLNKMMKQSGYKQGSAFPNPYGNAPVSTPIMNRSQNQNQNQNQFGTLTPQQVQQMQYYSRSPNAQLNNMFANEQMVMKSQYNNQFPSSIEHFGNVESPSETMAIQPIEPIEPILFINQEAPILSSNDFLLDIQNRSISDFANNNMVPNARKYTQNMAGTGVAQGNYIQDVTVDTGTDKSTPFQSQLDNFTGISSTYLNKREVGPMFSPAEQQQNWVFGQPILRPDEERYTVSMTKRNDMAPTQPIQVGPGLNTDPRIPATGGFHEFTRILPNNVSDYKANQLEGRVNMGKLTTSGLPTSYPGVGGSQNKGPIGVPKNRPPKDWSQVRRPTMTTKVGFVNNAELMRSDYQVDERPKNPSREQISYGYGSVKPNASINASLNSSNDSSSNASSSNAPCLSYEEPIGIAPSRPGVNLSNRSPTFMSLDNNIRSKADCNSTPIGNPAGQVSKTGPLLTNYYVNETDRGTINPAMIEQVNIKGQNKGLSYKYTDLPKTTMKETNEFAYVGDPNRAGDKGTWYSYTDAPKTTMKETNEFAYVGDPNRAGSQGLSYKYVDLPKTTMKETNEFAYVGDPNRAGDKGKWYSYDDAPRSTIKQSTNFSYTGIANTGKTKFIEESRFQYTGVDKQSSKENFANLDYNDLKSTLDNLSTSTGGADTFAIRGTTLVKNYFPGPMRQNIRQDAEDIMGKIDFGTFGSDSNMNGPGTLAQALPNPSYLQNNRFVAVPNANPNKLVGIDDRQLATYQNIQLKHNPLSMFTNNPDGDVPSFEADTDPDDFSDLITGGSDNASAYETDKKANGSLSYLGQNVYPLNGSVYEIDTSNPNANIVYNDQTENDYNPMISQGSSRVVNRDPSFSGLAYSGTFNKDEYGPDNTLVPLEYNDVGMENGPIITKDGPQVCKSNYALNFGSNTLYLDKDFK